MFVNCCRNYWVCFHFAVSNTQSEATIRCSMNRFFLQEMSQSTDVCQNLDIVSYFLPRITSEQVLRTSISVQSRHNIMNHFAFWIDKELTHQRLRFFWKNSENAFFPQKCSSRETNGTIRKCSSRAFQWMVMKVSTIWKFSGQFLCPSDTRWQKSPSVLKKLKLPQNNLTNSKNICTIEKHDQMTANYPDTQCRKWREPRPVIFRKSTVDIYMQKEKLFTKLHQHIIAPMFILNSAQIKNNAMRTIPT
jgi:hypothetical protein